MVADGGKSTHPGVPRSTRGTRVCRAELRLARGGPPVPRGGPAWEDLAQPAARARQNLLGTVPLPPPFQSAKTIFINYLYR
jgi:hypothetical protein